MTFKKHGDKRKGKGEGGKGNKKVQEDLINLVFEEKNISFLGKGFTIENPKSKILNFKSKIVLRISFRD
jgi:hypothetical protein